MSERDPHERIAITNQRHSWQVVAAALREFYEDYQEDPGPHSITAEAEPVLRGVENALGLGADERTTEILREGYDPHADDECDVCGAEPSPAEDRVFHPLPSTDGGAICDPCLNKARIAHAVSERSDEPAFAIETGEEGRDGGNYTALSGPLADQGG